MSETLLIGGPADGQRVNIPESTATFITHEVQFGPHVDHRYELRFISDGPKGVRVFVHESLPEAGIVAEMLIARYRGARVHNPEEARAWFAKNLPGRQIDCLHPDGRIRTCETWHEARAFFATKTYFQ